MTSDPVEARFAQAMAALKPPARLGIAVSGGGDSMALMHLAQRWGNAALCVATVDHGLRREAPLEAAHVARAARDLGLSHDVLRWQGWEGQGNLQNQARQARRVLLRDWAVSRELDAVLLGHTLEDQAETLLMRLARGSGVDGLSAMRPSHHARDMLWLRPLLGFERASLRDWLRDEGLDWCEDPSNDDLRFDRVKARHALRALEPLGLTVARLSQTAAQMQDARAALEHAASEAARTLCRYQHGDIIFDAPPFDALPVETRHRLAAEALCQIAGAPYRPRLSALRAALEQRRATLHGCVITRNRRELRLTRELQAVRRSVSALDDLWDGRWTVTPPRGTTPDPTFEIRALGQAGLLLCPDRNHWKLPRLSLLASPSVWHGPSLIAAPLAGLSPDWQITPARLRGVLTDTPHSH